MICDRITASVAPGSSSNGRYRRSWSRYCASEHDGYLERYLREHTPHVIGIGRKVQGRHKNGETFPMRLSVTEVRRHAGSQFIGLVSDIDGLYPW